MSTARVGRRLRLRLGVLLAGVGLVVTAAATPATAAPRSTAHLTTHQTVMRPADNSDWWL